MKHTWTHIHDCRGCEYLVSMNLHSMKYDWYYHARPGEPSIVGRYGNGPSEYWSCSLNVVLYADTEALEYKHAKVALGPRLEQHRRMLLRNKIESIKGSIYSWENQGEDASKEVIALLLDIEQSLSDMKIYLKD